MKDTLEGWQAQYPRDLMFERPSEAEVLNTHKALISDKIRLPLTLRRRSGRPVTKRKKSWMDRSARKRAKMACSNCLKEGHTKRKCPNMPAQ